MGTTNTEIAWFDLIFSLLLSESEFLQQNSEQQKIIQKAAYVFPNLLLQRVHHTLEITDHRYNIFYISCIIEICISLCVWVYNF